MKFNKKLIGTFAALVILSTLILTACKKGSNSSSLSGTQQLSVFLTDNPSPYDSVFIDIKYVEVKLDTSASHMHDDHFGDEDNNRNNDHKHMDQYGIWDTLNIVPGTYDVSKLRNGLDTLLGTGNIKGTIRKIRITLGSNNSLKVADVSYPLSLFPGFNNYLYVKINDRHHHEDGAGQTSLWIDFDISRSIVFANGQYYLRPVLRPFCDNNFARISGQVLPADANPLVTVYNATDTANAIPRADGDFKIRGLNPGTYNVLFKGSNGYRDTTIMNVDLQIGIEKHIPTITLTK